MIMKTLIRALALVLLIPAAQAACPPEGTTPEQVRAAAPGTAAALDCDCAAPAGQSGVLGAKGPNEIRERSPRCSRERARIVGLVRL